MRLLAPALLCATVLYPAGPPLTLEGVLARLDEASSSFKGMTANITRITHTAVLNDNSKESGTVSMLRAKPRDVRMLIEFTQPDAKSISFEDRKAQIYYPKMKQVEIYDLGKHGRLIDQFLLLGFGTSGRDLTKSYDVKLLGAESVGDRKTVKLELTPKSAEAREHLKKVELWILEDAAYPVQQKFYQGSGDHILITYADVKLNPAFTKDALALKMPNGVRKVYPQK